MPTRTSQLQPGLSTPFFALAVVGIFVALVISSYLYLRELSKPAPVKLWNAHRAELEQFADREFARHTVGSARISGGGASSGTAFDVPSFLKREDIGYVSFNDGVMIITFTFMPCDPVPELAYCSKRQPSAPLPQRKPEWTYFKAEELSTKWLYYKWDN